VSVNGTLSEIKVAIKNNTPSTALITKVAFEGPEVVLYSKNPAILAANGQIIKDLARKVRKRIVVRPDESVLLSPDKAADKIRQVVPEDAGITDIKFDKNFGEALIESAKPGLVIGKNGSTLSEIKLAVGWMPRVRRTPPISSKIVSSIRHSLLKNSETRKSILRKVGKRIHRAPTSRGGYWVRVTALGGFREVGRSSMYLQTPESKALIDCGVNVASGDKENSFPSLNVPEFSIQDLDAVIITHAHLDHSGFVPYLYYMGYEGPVYCTHPTRDLMFLLHWDYLDVTEREGKDLPYPRRFIKKMINHIIPLDYGEVTDISPDMRLTLHNAGHILGSSIAHFHLGEGIYNLAITGDLKFEKSRLFDPANVKFPRLETLITEGTYGGSADVQPSRREAEGAMVNIINDTINRGGKVLIPVFAVGRAQELMVALEEYVNKGVLNLVKIYLDGMIWEATGIHTTYPEYLNKDLRNLIFHKGRNPFLSEIFEKVTGTAMRSKVIDGDSSVILATSGMLSGGPVMEYLKALADNPRNSIIFVGYQSEGSLGRRIQKGWKEISVNNNGKTKVIPMNMSVNTVEGFSGHSDRNQIINYIRRLNPKPERIVIGHGEESKCSELASAVFRIFRAKTKAPQNLDTFRIK
jgi:KH/beta-lactamase-domain protein